MWRQPRSSDSAWQLTPQLSHHGEPLPLELGGSHCPAPAGCRIAAKTRDGNWLNVTTADGASEIIVTPPAKRAPPHIPGARVELFLRPPLPPPFEPAAKACIDAMIAQLHDHYFVMTRQRLDGSKRIQLAEVSTTGAFLQLDLLPEDIFAISSGPDVPRILLRLAMRADEFNLTNHVLDPRYGLWRQSTDAFKAPPPDTPSSSSKAVLSSSLHKAAPAKRLWPHHEESAHPETEHGNDLLSMLLHGRPRDTGNLHENDNSGRRPPPPEPPPPVPPPPVYPPRPSPPPSPPSLPPNTRAPPPPLQLLSSLQKVVPGISRAAATIHEIRLPPTIVGPTIGERALAVVGGATIVFALLWIVMTAGKQVNRYTGWCKSISMCNARAMPGHTPLRSCPDYYDDELQFSSPSVFSSGGSSRGSVSGGRTATQMMYPHVARSGSRGSPTMRFWEDVPI